MPEVPPLSRSLTDRVADVFGPDGPLARAMPDFEPRAGQTDMALAVARAFAEGRVLLAEAGTGTGKTLAYLVPAILSGQRVLISTGTKNLQEQIFFKDIPALRQALDVSFTATCMKGRGNYLCLHRLEQFGAASGDPLLSTIKEWSARTETGDRAELEGLPDDLPVWNEVSAISETCLGTECPRYDDCFVTRMRQQAAASDLVIVNHHLLCADASVRKSAYGEVIPACSHAILDEAHQLEDVATQYFGLSVSNYRLDELAQDIERLAASGATKNRKAREEIERAVERLRERARGFFTELAFAHRDPQHVMARFGDRGLDRRGATGRSSGTGVDNGQKIRATTGSLADTYDAAWHLTSALDIVQSALALLDSPAGPQSEESPFAEETKSLARRAGEIREELRFLLRAADDEYVYFVEFRGRGIFLRASPIDVSSIVRDLLLDRMRTTVLTSATLTVDGTFEYLRRRLGIAAADELRLPSEFDYSTQAILYLPPRMPDPRSEAFIASASRQVIDILTRTRGRAFVLFTSYATLRAVHAVAAAALDYPMLVQGSAPRSELLRRFRETPHSVLLATSSFWQGVDVIGEALSCVIIDKLPFASPGDPITAARIDAVRARGGDPFADYQVPLAILALQQGLGRLIRHRRDCGVLAILDPRLRTKWYGQRFLASLPPAPVIHDVTVIGRFLGDSIQNNS